MTTDPAIASSRKEVEQASLSARAFGQHTALIFLEAGIRPGMRVLDMCSGAGDVSFVARDLVGPEGEVIGFDQSPATVSYANERAGGLGYSNVRFVEAPVEKLPFGQEFDAAVGRVVLMYRRDPVADVRALMRCLRPGGLVIFQEFDQLAAKTVPAAPLVDHVRDWMLTFFAGAGIELEMGCKLYQTFKAAGLPAPEMRIDGFIGGTESIAPALLANVMRLLLPQVEAMGIASADEVQIDTLEQRMRADLARTGGTMSTPLLIGAWARLPA